MNIRIAKPKLTVKAQIAHMKSQGISFNYLSNEKAENFLLEHTYYFKIKSYAKNYDKYNHNNKYINLDFSYLQDLSRIDMHFRSIILKMTIDIEHFLKVQLLAVSQQNTKEDGYNIVDDFLLNNPDIKNTILAHSTNGYNASLIQKYKDNYPIWVFLEIISFGDLVKFYNFYRKRFPFYNDVYAYLWSTRILRNAAAHNSCILNRLRESFDDSKINNHVMEILKRNYTTLNTKKIKQYLKNPVIQDFITVLILYKKLDKNKNLLNKRIEELDILFRRCWKHASYYKKNNILIYSYNFIYSFFKIYKNKL